MGRAIPQPPPAPPAWRDPGLPPNRVVREGGFKPAFPPNREIKQGEPCCTRCGSGYSTHEDGTRSHPYEGPLPLTAWIAQRLARLFGGAR